MLDQLDGKVPAGTHMDGRGQFGMGIIIICTFPLKTPMVVVSTSSCFLNADLIYLNKS